MREDLLPDMKILTSVESLVSIKSAGEALKNLTKESDTAVGEVSKWIKSQEETEIDRFALDDELCQQPQRMGEATGWVALARAWVDYFNLMARTLESAVQDKLRHEWEDEGVKVVEARLSSVAAADPVLAEVRDLRALWAPYATGCEGIRDAVVQRSSALSKLVTLWENEYFAADSKVDDKKKGKK